MTSREGRGAIAQLGERLLCTQEVCGSIPHGSTTLRSQSHDAGSEYCVITVSSSLEDCSLKNWKADKVQSRQTSVLEKLGV